MKALKEKKSKFFVPGSKMMANAFLIFEPPSKVNSRFHFCPFGGYLIQQRSLLLGGSKVRSVSKTLRNDSQHHAKTCWRVCKPKQHVTSKNVGSCLQTMLRLIARGFVSNHFPFQFTFFLPISFTSLLGSFRNAPFPVSRNGVGVSPWVR